MSFGGSVLAMITTLKNNKLLLGKRNSYFRAKKNYLRAATGMKITYRKATEAELRLVRDKIKSQQKEDRFKTTIALLIIIPLIAFGVYKIINVAQEKSTQHQRIIQDKDIKEYQFFINDGDEMFGKRKWNNAIFQYTRALEIFPNEYDAQYRLALTYTYRCKHKNEGCFIGDSLVNRLMNHFPEDKKIQELNLVIRKQLND